jgi:hypothetical protein
MNPWKRTIACVVLGLSACANPEPKAPDVPELANRQTFLERFKRVTAAQVVEHLRDPDARDRLVTKLRTGGSVALTELPTVAAAIQAPDTSRSLEAAEAVPELRLRDADGSVDTANLLVAYAPSGDEDTWTEIPAFTLDGRSVSLDPKTPPAVPVIVIETNGSLAMQQNIARANLRLQQLGLQRTPEVKAQLRARTLAATTGRWTMRLDQIRLQDDKESWFSRTKIYAITSGVLSNNRPEIQIVDMPYIADDKITYYPHQIILDWTDYDYQAANILLYEHDDNMSYQSLVEALVSAVGAAGSLAGYPVVQAIAEIANRIIAAMPSSWFTNTDDYVDAFYTLEKGRTYTNYVGVSNNATVTLTPYYLAPNNP